MAKLIGTDPNQVPTNADLGTLSYQDSKNTVLENAYINAKGADGLEIGRDYSSPNNSSRLFFNSSTANWAVFNNSGIFKVQSGAEAGTTSGNYTALSLTTSNMTIGGNLVVGNGYGIDFSATANSSGTTTSEVLDDYEEGTWTPTSTSTVFPTAQGRYTKVGRLVYASFKIRVATSINANFFQLSGLPFVNGNSTGGQNLGSMGNTDMGTNQFTFHVAGSGTAILLRNLSNTDWLRYNAYAGKYIWGAVTYTSS
jgi:hypothetical protein